MPLFIVIAALLAAEGPDERPIVVTQRPWAPFISPMGEPFRTTSVGDDPLARWFGQADRNRDGMLTTDEMNADAERFFATLDRNRDKEIDPEELAVYESEIAPEVQVNSKWKPTRQAAAEAKPSGNRDLGDRRRQEADNNVDGYQLHGLQGAARYGLLNLPEPVAGADADFNRGTTLEEFRRAAAHRFQLLDSKGLGRLTFQDLQPLLPSRPKPGERVNRATGADARIGQPFPRGN